MKNINMRDLQGSQMASGNQTITEASVVVKRLQTPEGMLALIELYVGSVAFLLLFLVAFGSLRRRNNNPMLNVVLWAAYTLSGYLITYTLGLMRESPFHNLLFPLWATFLMIFLGSSNSFSALSLEDNEQWKKYACQHVVTFIGLLTLWTLYLTTLPSRLAVFLLYFVILALKTTERALSLVSVSAFGRDRMTKWVADHMSSKHRCLDPCADPETMKGYKYVVKVSRTVLEKVFGEVAAPKANFETVSGNSEEEVITIERVWDCKGPLLSSSGGDRDGKFKDICLSYAFYLLLRLKFLSYSLPEEAHRKAWHLIRDGILQKENGYERAFRIAEVELTFFHDFFYTNYPIIFQARLWQLKVVELLCLITGTMVTVVFLMPKTTKPQDVVVQLVTSSGWRVDVLVTAVVLMVFICVELVQLFLMAISDWAKVEWLCNYVQKQSWQGSKRIEKLIGLICGVHLKPWERKLRQYSFLESYNQVPSRFLYHFCKINFVDVHGRGQKQSAPVRLSADVKKAVFDSLMKSNRKLANGETSLMLNNMSDELSWACRLETQTEVIMVWHIATSFLEYKRPLNHNPNFNIATNLSKYLAYLVAFAPRLLPDHLYDTENIFNQVILESREELKMCKTYGERIHRLKDIGEIPEDTETPENMVIHRGARLGVQLLKENQRRIWKILAEFWAELILYVAPSDKAKAHVEHLANGGEFVTHLWALVSHAGIEREPSNKWQTLRRSQSWPQRCICGIAREAHSRQLPSPPSLVPHLCPLTLFAQSSHACGNHGHGQLELCACCGQELGD